jgi:glutaredoxin 2
MHFIDFDNHVLEKIDSKTAKNIIGKHRINVAKKIVKKQV